MSDNEQPVDIDDLDSFENDFFQREKPVEEVPEEKIEEVPEEIDEDGDDSPEVEDEDDDEPEEEEEPEEEPEAKAKKGRKSFKERIDELTAEKYEARREVELLRREMEQLRVKSEVKEDPVKVQLPEGAPDHAAVDDKGDPVYLLGEFDPKFIADLTRFTIRQEYQAEKEAEAQKAAMQAEQEVKDAVVSQYAERFAKVEEEVPELRENVANLQTAFRGIDENYGEYLAMTIMSMESGPQIMNCLSQNIGEAQRIVASGPAAATLQLGRLDARLTPAKQEEEKSKPKEVSKAPPPPDNRARGTGGRFTVSPDTDDQDAFEKVFFQKG